MIDEDFDYQINNDELFQDIIDLGDNNGTDENIHPNIMEEEEEEEDIKTTTTNNKRKRQPKEETKKKPARKTKLENIKAESKDIGTIFLTKEQLQKKVDDLLTFNFKEASGLNTFDLKAEIEKVKKEIDELEIELKEKEETNDEENQIDLNQYELEDFKIPEHCVPIRCDVRIFDFDKLAQEMNNFDVICMDPPWKLAGAAPTRGVALGYAQLQDDAIANIPIPKIQQNGFLFIWVINSRYSFALKLFEKWGYEMVDDISWVKATVNRRLAKGHGFYLQHAKETCLVGKKGNCPTNLIKNVASDVIYSQRRGQSQKPTEMYELVEKLVPNGKYLEIFARRNNLRNYWCSIGLEL